LLCLENQEERDEILKDYNRILKKKKMTYLCILFIYISFCLFLLTEFLYLENYILSLIVLFAYFILIMFNHYNFVFILWNAISILFGFISLFTLPHLVYIMILMSLISILYLRYVIMRKQNQLLNEIICKAKDQKENDSLDSSPTLKYLPKGFLTLKSFICYFCLLGIIGIFLLCLINEYVIVSTKNNFVDNNVYQNVDCIMVLGAGVKDGEPTPMLKDRLEKGIELYKQGYAKKIIMSGDHGRAEYDEVNVMKKYAIAAGIPSSDIFMDHAGFSTYDSVYRASAIFGVKKMIIVTQKYHLYRALYLAKSLGIEAIGAPAEDIIYNGNTYRELREVLARNKDFLKALLVPPSTYLGEAISVSGDGNITND